MTPTFKAALDVFRTPSDQPDLDVIEHCRYDILSLLYKILDTIDSKASHMLRLNGMILAVLGILFAFHSSRQGARAAESFAPLLLLIVSLAPIGACLTAVWIFRIKWPFIGYRTVKNLDQPMNINAIFQEFDNLGRVCEERTNHHKWMWILSMISIVLLLISMIVLTFFSL